jgi:transcription initiation factor TFIIIB Brf1 subunit/transcription initiation factor TFIIB
LNGKKPNSIASAAISIAATSLKVKISFKDLGIICGVGEDTIRRTVKLMKAPEAKIFPLGSKN